MSESKTPLENLRNKLFKKLAGKRLGKKFPILWKIYDYYFCKTWNKGRYFEIQENKMIFKTDEPDYNMRRVIEDYAWAKVHEPNTTKIVRANVKAGDVCIDCGANIGYFTLLFAKLVGNEGRVFSFEPVEKYFNYLCENIIANGYIWCAPIRNAVSFKSQLLQLWTTSHSYIWVPSINLDILLTQVPKIDFIKADLEGAEPFMWQGMTKLLETNPNLKMIMEYYPEYMRKLGNDPEKFLKQVEERFNVEFVEGDYGKDHWNLFLTPK